MLIFMIFSFLIAILAVIFALQNTAAVTITFLLWQIQGSLALVLLVSLFAGVLMCFFATLPALLKDKWTARSNRKRLTEMEAALTVHRRKLEEAQAQLAAQAAPPAVPPVEPAALPAEITPPVPLDSGPNNI